MSVLSSEKIAIFDTETTGTDIEECRIVQIAVIEVDDGQVVGEWKSLVNPGCEIPAEATEVHKVTNEMVESAPDFKGVWSKFLDRCAGRRLLGYNAYRFDFPLIQNEMRRIGIEPQQKPEVVIDPLIWIRDIDKFVKGKGRHKLGKTCERWKIPVENAHDALADCRMTWALAQKIFERRKLPDIRTLLKRQVPMAARQEAEYQAYRARQEAKKSA
jgi:DNA polymerase III epsilon subunit family exonuclease